LANVFQSSNPNLQELALQLNFGSEMLQVNEKHHEILTQADSVTTSAHILNGCLTAL